MPLMPSLPHLQVSDVRRVRAARRGLALLLIPLVIGSGLLMKQYDGPGGPFVANWLTSVPYEVMLMLIGFLVWPRRSMIVRIALMVWVFSSGLEFLQLSQADWLQAIRSHRLGMLAIGNRFSWTDLIAYPIGCAVGCLVLIQLVRIEPREAAEALDQ